MSTPARYEPMPRHYCLGSTMKIVGQKCGLAPTQVKRVLDECLALVLKRSDQGLRILMPPELMSRLKKRTPAPARPRGLPTSSRGSWRRRYQIINNKIKKAPVETAAPTEDSRPFIERLSVNPPPPSPIVLD